MSLHVSQDEGLSPSDRRELERKVVALGEAIYRPERVASRVLAQLDDLDLERLRCALLRDFKEPL